MASLPCATLARLVSLASYASWSGQMQSLPVVKQTELHGVAASSERAGAKLCRSQPILSIVSIQERAVDATCHRVLTWCYSCVAVQCDPKAPKSGIARALHHPHRHGQKDGHRYRPHRENIGGRLAAHHLGLSSSSTSRAAKVRGSFRASQPESENTAPLSRAWCGIKSVTTPSLTG